MLHGGGIPHDPEIRIVAYGRPPYHDSSMRIVAMAVAHDLKRIAAGEPPSPPMGLNRFLRTHAALRSHGWVHVDGADRLREICERVFASEPSDTRAFVRGMRGVAGIVVEGSQEGPATLADTDVFWSCVEALGRETGIVMPVRTSSRGRPSMRGH